VDPHRLYVFIRIPPLTSKPTNPPNPHSSDDSAAHISEETAGAARAAPIAILVGVAATATLGWLTYIAASFALVSVSDLLATDLALPMGQLFLDVLGKRRMLAIWSLIIVVQVSMTPLFSRCNGCVDELVV
jgi:hypothetical protein